MPTATKPVKLTKKARSLIEKTLDWFQDGERWSETGWGVASNDEEIVIDREHLEDWKSFEKEHPGLKLKTACIVGALLYNNNGKNDDTLRKATEVLMWNIPDFDKYLEEKQEEYDEEGWGPWEPDAEDILIDFNDSQADDFVILKNVIAGALQD